MSFVNAVWGQYPNGTSPFGYFVSSIENYDDYLVPILLAMQARLVSQEVFIENQVGISFSELPSSQLLADFQCNLLPADGEFIEGQVTGLGRWGSGFVDRIHVNIYGRNGLDRAYLDTSLLTDSTLGLLVKSQAAFDALQLFLPVDNQGNALTEEPIRLLYITEPIKYKRSPEWSYISMVFESRAAFNISPVLTT